MNDEYYIDEYEKQGVRRGGDGDFAKNKGGKEFKVDLTKNNTAYSVVYGGKSATKEQYEAY